MKTDPKPLISVSVLLWHSKKHIKSCLESLLAQTCQDFELIAADNNEAEFTDRGTDEFWQTIEENRAIKERLTFIDNKKNIGFAAGHNKNTERAKGEYILWLNHDVILSPDFLDKAVAVLKRHPKAGGVQARCLRLEEKEGGWQKTGKIDNCGLVVLKNRRIIARGQGRPAEGLYLKEEEVFGVDGAAPLFRKKTLEDVKLCLSGRCEYMDEDFLSYKEDVDLAWRFRLYGWQAVYGPEVLAWHARGSGDSAKTDYWGIIQERRKINDLSKKLSFRNQRWLQIKNEAPALFWRHFPYWFSKEILAWGYFFVFEGRNLEAIPQMFKGFPLMWRKRRIIQQERKKRGVGYKEMRRWFI